MHVNRLPIIPYGNLQDIFAAYPGCSLSDMEGFSGPEVYLALPCLTLHLGILMSVAFHSLSLNRTMYIGTRFHKTLLY